ncbi:hypothetical protein [Pseudonocardia ailaonensis]|uniref:hypothetical protein n=1 Tax=Pseudonocardia ailaonensis TaxID=367279 RepID=UPI0031CFF4CC
MSTAPEGYRTLVRAMWAVPVVVAVAAAVVFLTGNGTAGGVLLAFALISVEPARRVMLAQLPVTDLDPDEIAELRELRTDEGEAAAVHRLRELRPAAGSAAAARTVRGL